MPRSTVELREIVDAVQIRSFRDFSVEGEAIEALPEADGTDTLPPQILPPRVRSVRIEGGFASDPRFCRRAFRGQLRLRQLGTGLGREGGRGRRDASRA
jgi:hypothetical protein